MENIARLQSLGFLDRRVPRYTSYPTAPNFSAGVGAAFQGKSLERLEPAEPVSVYVHIPFCERLCWFCACHTQGTKTLGPVESYIEGLEKELALVARKLPAGVSMGRLHWGGGTPTILPPPLIHRLAEAIRKVFPPAADFDFSVEIDPTMVDAAKIRALAADGLTRASIGIQDFDPKVQAAIGRIQSFEATRHCVDDLRTAGVASLNADLVYGLPHQTEARIEATLARTLELGPDRLALFGYAHVPWASKRQKLIDEAALPDDVARARLASIAARRFVDAGFRRIGIDHFSKPGDALEVAAQSSGLRRNFQGYTDDACMTLIGLGASSISRFADGYVQNAPATAAWRQRVDAGALPGAKGHVLTEEDLLRGRAIEMLMCRFRIDMAELAARFPLTAPLLKPEIAAAAQRFGALVRADETGLAIEPGGEPVARVIASAFDGYFGAGGRFSRAS